MNSRHKAAGLVTLGLATLWGSHAASADVISGNTIATDIPVANGYVLFTSNASVTMSDNSTANVANTGIIAVNPTTASTSSVFDLPTPDAPPGGSIGAFTDALLFVGVDANNMIVAGTSTINGEGVPTVPTFATTFGSAAVYDDILAALQSDDVTTLAANLPSPSSISLDLTTLSPTEPISQVFTLYEFPDATSPGVLLSSPEGGDAGGTITVAPEPASAAMLGVPALVLALARRRKA